MSDQPMQTPTEDLRKDALKHYDKVSTPAHEWLSTIPNAINFYFDMKSDKPLDREDIESFGWEFKKENGDAMLFEMLKDDFLGRRRSTLIMAFNPVSQWVCIALVIEKLLEKNEERTFFAGNTRNKSEFEKVLKQVGVWQTK
jgi:hypothetical protein